MTFFLTPVLPASESFFEPLPLFPTLTLALNVPSEGFLNSCVPYHGLVIVSLNRLWTRCRPHLGIFLGTFSSWHGFWHLVSAQLVFEQTNKKVNHGIKFT